MRKSGWFQSGSRVDRALLSFQVAINGFPVEIKMQEMMRLWVGIGLGLTQRTGGHTHTGFRQHKG